MDPNSCGTELLNYISEFNFESIPADWVRSAWESNFNDVLELTEDVTRDVMDMESLPQLLKNCSSKCRRCVILGGDETIWQEISSNGYCRPFIAYLYHLIDGVKNDSSNAKRNALLAADTYVSLCAINGASAYHVFNAALFRKSLQALKSASIVLTQRQGQAPEKPRVIRRQKKKAQRPRSPSLASSAGGNEDDPVDELDLDEFTNLIRNFLKTLWLFLGHYSLTENDDVVECFIGCLCHLLGMTSGGNDSTVRAEEECDLSHRSPAGLAFAILHKLFDSERPERMDLLAGFAFKNLLPYLLMVSTNVNSSTIPVGIVYLRDLAMKFVQHLLQDKANSVAKSVYVLLQHLCVKVTDKADYRVKVSHVVNTLAQELPNDTFQLFLEWLNKYSRSQKIGYRAFAIDVVLQSFNTTFAKLAHAVGKKREEAEKLLELCLNLIVGRCSDKAPTVRTRALTALTQIMEDTVKRLALDHGANDDLGKKMLLDFVKGAANGIANGPASAEGDQVPTPAGNENGAVTTPTGEEAGRIPLQLLLLRRCDDEKVLVRKAATQALELLLTLFPNCLNEEAIVALQFRCMDVAVSVRKQALESLAKLFSDHRDNSFLEKSWLVYVLPCIVDRENAVQEKCAETFCQLILDQISDNGEDVERAWRLLNTITLDGATTRYSQRVLKYLQTQSSVKNQLIRIIERATTQESRAIPAWFLLSEFAEQCTFNLQRLQTSWNDGTLDGQAFNYAMKIISAKAKTMAKAALKQFASDIRGRLETFSLPTENIAESLSALWQVASAGKTITDFNDWCKTVGRKCLDYLSPIIFSISGTDEQVQCSQRNEDDTLRRLFMLGELFQLCSATMVNQRNYYLVVALVAANKYTEIVGRPDSAMQCSSEITSSQGSAPGHPEVINTDLSPLIRSHAIIALGKLCLQDETFAKKTVAILVAELDAAADFSIRNNIIIILSDLCLRYTSLIDRHIGRISRRLRDDSALVRKQTLTMITNLLKEDYLKWRGALLFRFLTALLDDDSKIRAFAEFCLVNILAQRQPAMFFLHFLECLFYFNDARHPMWFASVDLEGDDEQKEEFALAGNENRLRRLYIYRFMLSHFTDQQRFQLTSRVVQDILGGIVDEIITLGANMDEVVADCLIVLASKEMKLTSLAPAAIDEFSEEEQDPAGVAIAEAAKKAISQKVKQNAMEQIVPTLMSLRIILQRNSRPGLERLLVIYLVELMKDYKKEMEEIMAWDKVFFKELAYDLKQQEKNGPIELPAHLF